MRGSFWDCFRPFGGEFGGVLGGKLEENERRKAERGSQTDYLKIALNRLFSDQGVFVNISY